ncbi:MAG: penicillin-binding protein activator LpoB [candidate division Zixibacteria bacterium]|nr:penicillin-binding protein activator LpoB [candidate division Zixibacteria bacterium]
MKKVGVLVLISFLIFACGSSRKVTRVGADTTIDLSGKWNDVDARLVSQEMISDCLSRAWINNFNMETNAKPVVTVGTIRNKSREHIDTETFSKDFERELINSGKVKFVAARGERDEIREERMEQQEFASDETAKRLAEETGADFILQGSIKTIVDQIEGRRVIFYQTDMELLNVESNEKVWIGTKKIKKDITQKGHKW